MGDDSYSTLKGAAKKPLLQVQTDVQDDELSQSRCANCCLFPVISPPGNKGDARLHGTLLKDLPWIGAVFVTFAVLMSILFGLMLRNYGADAPVVNPKAHAVGDTFSAMKVFFRMPVTLRSTTEVCNPNLLRSSA